MPRARTVPRVESLEDRILLHNHIPIDFLDGRIVLLPESSEVRVYDGSFDTFLFITEEPSISDATILGLPTHLTPDSIIYFTVTSPLLYHDGTDFAPTGSANVQWFDPGPVFITATSGVQENKPYGQVEPNGKMHVHPLIFLNSGQTGAYAAQFFLTTDAEGIEPSDRFWHVWNFGLGETEFAEALAAFTITADAGGPYQSSTSEEFSLQGSGAGPGNLVFEWDLNDDGDFGDAVGTNPLITPALLADLGMGQSSGTFIVHLRVSNEFEDFAIHSTTLELTSEDSTPPDVTDVFVAGANWNGTFLDYLENEGIGSATLGYRIPEGDAQLHTLPWNQLHAIAFQFSEAVLIDASHLQFEGVQASYDVASAQFSYDDATNTARWIFPTFWGADKVLATLTGVTDLAGNPLAVGSFAFRFNVLPGNVSRTDLTVNPIDWNFTRNRLFQNTTTADYTPFADVDGNGAINPVDWNFVRNRLFSTLAGLDEPGGSESPEAMVAFFIPPGTAEGTGTEEAAANSTPKRQARIAPARSGIAPDYVLDTYFAEMGED